MGIKQFLVDGIYGTKKSCAKRLGITWTSACCVASIFILKSFWMVSLQFYSKSFAVEQNTCRLDQLLYRRAITTRFWMVRNIKLLSSAETPSETQVLKPSLFNSNLWRGNCPITHNGTPYLIDSAVYFGQHIVDIAMTKFFGGFDIAFYQAHDEYFSKVVREKERHDICQGLKT